MSEQKRDELAKELEYQKKRFLEAAQKSAERIHTDFSPQKWIKKYPLKSAAIIVAGGFILGQMLTSGLRQRTAQRPSPRTPRGHLTAAE